MLKMIFTHARYGGYEVSTKGDPRFSALNAVLPDGLTIEEFYQCRIKGYDPEGRDWRKGKGKPPLDTTKDLWTEYLNLWRVWASNHLTLMEELRDNAAKCGGVLSDRFATTPINQARALAIILNETRSLVS